MKRMRPALSMMLLVFLVNPWVSSAASDEPPARMMAQEKKRPEASGDLQPIPQERKAGSGTGMPVYAPPFRGAPAGRVGGGTRGAGEEKASVLVLAPDHVGLTTQQQPSLYWFLSAPTKFPLEFTLIEAKAVKPLVEKRLDPPEKPGIQHVRLADYALNLQDNVLYQWFITLIPDAERRSKDILSGGLIKRIEPSGGLIQTLDKREKAERVHIYAKAGFWYDAFMRLCDMIEMSPDDAYLRQMRASLLEQVGLDQVARDLK